MATRELFIGKNRRAPQKARRPKDFFLSITPAAFERKLGRGWNLFRPGLYFWLVACALLEVGTVRAEFTIADSQVLGAMGADVDAISGDVGRMASTLSAISLAWDNSIPYIANDVNEIKVAVQSADARLNSIVVYQDATYTRLGNVRDIFNTHASANDANLRDLRTSNNAISSTLSAIHDIISGWSFPTNSVSSSVSVTNIVDFSPLVGVISNAIASTPSVNVVVTNFLTTSGAVDMSVVTNILLQMAIPYDYYKTGRLNQFPSFKEFIADLVGGSMPDGVKAAQYLARSNFGLNMAILDSALVSQSTASSTINPWRGASEYWFSTGIRDPDFKYSIFDAYNTIPLGRMTNQLEAIAVTNGGIYRTLQGWNNFDFHAKVAISNTLNAILAKLDGDITINQSPQSVSTSIAVTNILENALGSSDDVDLDYEVEHDMPEWIPSYQEAAGVYTNDESYFDASRNLTTSMYDGKTNSLGTIYAAFDRDAVRLNERLSFGGINPGHGHGYLGSWSFRIGFQESSSAYQELKRVCRGVYNVIVFVGHLCVFFIFSRRIVKFVTKPFPV